MLLFKNKQKLIEDLHNEIDASQEKLLEEARAIINSTLPCVSKAERLKRAGFINNESVVKMEKGNKILVKSIEQAKLIDYYKHNYPFQKFITEEILQKLCKKYGLIYAPVKFYKKDVPEKNLSEIENVKVLNYPDYASEKKWSIIRVCESVFSERKLVIQNEHFNYTHKAEKYLRENGFLKKSDSFVRSVENCTADVSGLFIAAPKSHFDLTELNKNNTHGYFSVSMSRIPDPIVFRFVRGGIQVITKWGKEAGDEDLVNEILN